MIKFVKPGKKSKKVYPSFLQSDTVQVWVKNQTKVVFEEDKIKHGINSGY